MLVNKHLFISIIKYIYIKIKYLIILDEFNYLIMNKYFLKILTKQYSYKFFFCFNLNNYLFFIKKKFNGKLFDINFYIFFFNLLNLFLTKKKGINYNFFLNFNKNMSNLKFSNFFKTLNILKKQKSRLKYFLVLKPTLNNFFVYIYNLYFQKVGNISRYVSGVNYSLSVGAVGYKGPTRTSKIAVEKLGEIFAKKLFEKKIKSINLILMSKFNYRSKFFFRAFIKNYNKLVWLTFFEKKNYLKLKDENNINMQYFYQKHIKKMMRSRTYFLKFQKIYGLSISQVYFLPKVAHNGCRYKKVKRL